MTVMKFIGYAPDVDPTTPGVFVNCSALIPTQRGYEGAPSPVSSLTLPVLPAACAGALSIRKADDTVRTFAGTSQFVYEDGSSTWTPRTSTQTALTSGHRWRFAQFGDVTIAATPNNVIQFIDDATLFAACTANAPKAGVIETLNEFVLAFDFTDQGGLYWGTDTAVRDGWWCSALGDYTDWTPSVNTQAATNRLRSSPGPIVGAKRFGYQCVAYKNTSMYLGTYVGSSNGAIWDWQRISGEIGAVTHEAIVDVGTVESPRHIFMGVDSFYAFAGGYPVDIGGAVKDTVFGALNRTFMAGCCAAHDKVNKTIRFYYPVSSSYNPDKCVVFNYLSGQWGRDDRQVQFAFPYQSQSVMTYDDLGTYYATYDDLPLTDYDSSFALDRFESTAIFNTASTLQTFTGASASASITFHDFGDEYTNTLVSGVALRFNKKPTSANCISFYRQRLGDSLTQGETVTMKHGRFDFQASAPWHRLRIDTAGDFETIGYQLIASQDGVAT